MVIVRGKLQCSIVLLFGFLYISPIRQRITQLHARFGVLGTEERRPPKLVDGFIQLTCITKSLCEEKVSHYVIGPDLNRATEFAYSLFTHSLLAQCKRKPYMRIGAVGGKIERSPKFLGSLERVSSD